MKSSRKLETAFSAYAQRIGVCLTALRFLLNNAPLDPERSPHAVDVSCGMQRAVPTCVLTR
jgi:hypothetical protein